MKIPSYIRRLRAKGWEIGKVERKAAWNGWPTDYRLVKSPRMCRHLDIEAEWSDDPKHGERNMLDWERSVIGAERAHALRDHVYQQLEKALVDNPDLKTLTLKLSS